MEALPVRVGAFVAAFVVPFAVAALPLLTLLVNPFASSSDDGRLALRDVPLTAPIEPATESAPMAYGSASTSASPGCDSASIVAIEG